MIAAMAEVDAVCEHVHLPMQSGSTQSAQAHAAPIYARRILRVCRSSARAVPGLALTTDIIVGFPGETEEDFEETLSAVREVGFDDAYTFKFSPREGTPATRMPASETISDEVASERLARLIETVAHGSRSATCSCSASEAKCSIEKEARRGGLLQARTRDFKTVIIPGEPSLIGTYAHRRADRHDRLDLYRRNRSRARVASSSRIKTTA